MVIVDVVAHLKPNKLATNIAQQNRTKLLKY